MQEHRGDDYQDRGRIDKHWKQQLPGQPPQPRGNPIAIGLGPGGSSRPPGVGMSGVMDAATCGSDKQSRRCLNVPGEFPTPPGRPGSGSRPQWDSCQSSRAAPRHAGLTEIPVQPGHQFQSFARDLDRQVFVRRVLRAAEIGASGTQIVGKPSTLVRTRRSAARAAGVRQDRRARGPAVFVSDAAAQRAHGCSGSSRAWCAHDLVARASDLHIREAVLVEVLAQRRQELLRVDPDDKRESGRALQARGGTALTGLSGLPALIARISNVHHANTFSASVSPGLAPARIDLRLAGAGLHFNNRPARCARSC